MTEFPGLDPKRAAAYASCVQPYINLAFHDVGNFDYDSEYANDWINGFLGWVDPASCLETSSDLAKAKARIKRLESALMDALDQNGYGIGYGISPIGKTPTWVDTARAAIDWRGEYLEGPQEMAAATPYRLQEILQIALHSEYMRPCDERP